LLRKSAPFETSLNGPLFWAFDKKRHTYAPSQDLRPYFWNLAKNFMNLFSKSDQNRSLNTFYEFAITIIKIFAIIVFQPTSLNVSYEKYCKFSF